MGMFIKLDINQGLNRSESGSERVNRDRKIYGIKLKCSLLNFLKLKTHAFENVTPVFTLVI